MVLLLLGAHREDTESLFLNIHLFCESSHPQTMHFQLCTVLEPLGQRNTHLQSQEVLGSGPHQIEEGKELALGHIVNLGKLSVCLKFCLSLEKDGSACCCHLLMCMHMCSVNFELALFLRTYFRYTQVHESEFNSHFQEVEKHCCVY